MKKVYTILFYTFILIVFTSCTNQSKNVNFAIIVINNSSEENIVLYNSDFTEIKPNHINSNSQKFQLKKESSNFLFMFSVSDKMRFQFSEPIYMEKGDSLIISIDSLNNVSYSGDLSCVYTNETLLNFGQKNIHKVIKEKYTNNPKEIISFINRQKEINSNQIAQKKSEGRYSMEVLNYLETNETYKLLIQSFRYLKYHQYYTYEDFRSLNPDTLNLNIGNIIQNLTDPYFNREFHQLLQLIIEFEYDEKYELTDDKEKYQNVFKNKWDIIDSNFKDEAKEIAAYLLIKNISYELPNQTRNYPQFIESLKEVKNFVDSKENNFLKSNFYHFYNKVFKILPGEKAPEFTLPNQNGEKVSLTEFHGKIVYLTYWGTWCGPCISSIPSYNSTVEKYKNENQIEFIFIGLEYGSEEINNWKDYLSTNIFNGVHLVAEKQFLNAEIADYMIRFAPRYIIIGKDGKIINPNALSPQDSHKDIEILLNSE